MNTGPLLRQNSELRADRVWNWSLPAWVTQLPDGRTMNVCPSAGACSKMCYALNGTYLFPGVRAAHQRNLALALDDRGRFVRTLSAELAHPRFRPARRPRLPELPRDHLHPRVAGLLDMGCAAVRIHDGGDFFSDSYMHTWVTIARRHPRILFYSYTKSVTMARRVLTAPAPPPNFLWIYSLGGKEDHLLDLREGKDRHAEVFPTAAALADAGYTDQESNDLLCVLAPSTRIGIVANNIPSFRKRQGDNTFGQIEASTTRHARRRRGITRE